MKRVVSVSLGTSKRDKSFDCTILDVDFRIERIGTDGSKQKFKEMMEQLDGKVDALGVGGADIWLVSGDRRYAFTDVLNLVSGVKQTPVVDGSGLKHTLEREAIDFLQRRGIINFAREKVLLVSAVDRFGLAQALAKHCPNVVFGDLCFGLGLPIPIRSYGQVQMLASVLLPIVTRLPIDWFYPTGEKQEKRTPKFPKLFAEATIIAGDWHYIRRFAPDRMDGKTILTQTLRQADIAWLRDIGVARIITTTPAMGGETFATNVMEGVVLSLLGKSSMEVTDLDYLHILDQLEWEPNVVDLKK